MSPGRAGGWEDLQRKERAITVLLGLATTVAAFLLPEELVPMPLGVIRVLAPVVVILALIAAFLRRPGSVAMPLLVASAGLAGSLAIYVALVEVVPTGMNESQRALVGFSYTEAGVTEIRQAGLEGESRREIVSRLGYDRISHLWGWSYWAVVAAMATALLMLLGGGAYAIGVAVGPGGGGGRRRKRRPPQGVDRDVVGKAE